MSERIEPALSAEGWADPTELGYFDWHVGIVDVSYQNADIENLPVKLIAVANAALPDSDPRKITGEKIQRIRDVLGVVPSGPVKDEVAAFADALESYGTVSGQRDTVNAAALADLMPRIDDAYRAELVNRDVLRFLAGLPQTEEAVARALFSGDVAAARVVLERLTEKQRLARVWEVGRPCEWIATGG